MTTRMERLINHIYILKRKGAVNDENNAMSFNENIFLKCEKFSPAKILSLEKLFTLC